MKRTVILFLSFAVVITMGNIDFSYAQDCGNIKSNAQRLECFDRRSAAIAKNDQSPGQACARAVSAVIADVDDPNLVANAKKCSSHKVLCDDAVRELSGGPNVPAGSAYAKIALSNLKCSGPR